MPQTRSPVVGIFGHIDHGKSTLIDYIRETNVTATRPTERLQSFGREEAGGITQHVSAYEVKREKDGQETKITFLDTPGHEAFESIRTRGANIADIAVLVVSAEDGVKPQTLEVFKYIQESKVPYIVAITKIDKPAADIERTKQNLAENGIYVEGYGGDIPVVNLSSKTGVGTGDLLDMIALVAEMEHFTGESDELASGIILESRLDPKRGITSVAIIKNGTLHCGTFVVAGGAIAPIRFLLDAEGNDIEEATFSSPVQIIGWDKLPMIGHEFKTFLKKDDALAFLEEEDSKKIKSPERKIISDDLSILPLIVKADTAGSLEAIENELSKLSRERIVPKIILSGVGSVNEKDIKAALATAGTNILSFHTKVDPPAFALAERSGISILPFSIIYELTAKVNELLASGEPRIEVEEVIGRAKVLKIFSTAKNKQVVGARVLSGKFSSSANIKIIRREAEIGHAKVRELQQAKIAATEVLEGAEFGAMVESKIEIATGDILEAIILVTK